MLKIKKKPKHSSSEENHVEPGIRVRKKGKKAVKISIIVVIVLAIVAGGIIYKKHSEKKTASSSVGAGTSVVMRGNLVSSITGSGTVEPIEQRDIVPLVNGKITESKYNEGDAVAEGDTLYKFEMTAAENAIKTAENSVKSAQNSVEKAKNTLTNRSDSIASAKEDIEELTVYASASGKVSDLSVKTGDNASDSICKITNYKEQTATIPFGASHISSISVGDRATVELDKYMMNASGTVSRKYTSPSAGSDGSVVYNVEINITDDITLSEGIKATATVHTASGDISSASYGSIKYADPVTVNAEQKGKVKTVNVKNGDWVNKGDVIAVLKNTDLTDALKTANQSYNEAKMSLSDSNNSLQNAQSSLEDKKEAAKDYIVSSPINGVVLSKDFTKGDTVSGNSATILMVVADMSKMKFTIEVDELDIAKIKLGQSVQVTADALEGEKITGTITTLSKSGTASNGVTTYPIEVTIDNPGNLMPGMNVSAEIIVDQSDNTLYLPLTAVEYFGGKYYATVVGEIEKTGAAASMQGKRQANQDGTGQGGFSQRTQTDGEKTENQADNFEKAKQSNGNEQNTGQNKATTENTKQSNNSTDKSASQNGTSRTSMRRAQPQIKLSGSEKRVEVTVGLTTDDYYEIKSGLTEGQVVKNTTQATSSSSSMQMGGMPGGMGGMGTMGGGMGTMRGGTGGNRTGGR